MGTVEVTTIPMPDEITADDVLAIVREIRPDLPAFVEMTGGGVATVFVGEPKRARCYDGSSDEGDRYLLGIGPGWYAPDARFSFVELFVGHDDFGESAEGFGGYVKSRAGLRARLRLLLHEPDWRDAA